MTTHDLKVHPQHFAALADNSKPFEARKDDRDPPFAVGDTLRLREWDPGTYDDLYALRDVLREEATEAAYTGRTLERRVTYVLPLKEWPTADTVLGLDTREALRAERARIAAALGAGADSDLVSLATTLAAFYAAHAETVERQRDALRELVTLKDEHPLDYEARKAAAWDAARRALEGGE